MTKDLGLRIEAEFAKLREFFEKDAIDQHEVDCAALALECLSFSVYSRSPVTRPPQLVRKPDALCWELERTP
jgi:hypothetical protein